MLEDYWLGVTRGHHSRVSNGLLEGLNSLIQAAKRRARGYRTARNYKAMIYLVAGKLSPGPYPRNPHETWRSPQSALSRRDVVSGEMPVQ